LARAVRSDKFTLAALEATLALYRDPEQARVEIPVLRMLTEDAAEIRRRGEALQRGVGGAAELIEGESEVGGGSFPGAKLKTWLVVTVTNQSGIAGGLYDQAAYSAVQRRVAELLGAHAGHLDGAYLCPHHPEITGPCQCRKPGPKLFRDAQTALGIDFAKAYW